MKRRDFILTGSALAVSGGATVTPATAAADVDKGLLTLEREYWRLDEQADRAEKAFDHQLHDSLYTRLKHLESEIAATPARTVQGMLAKLRVVVGTDMVMDEPAETFAASLLRDAEHLAGSSPTRSPYDG